MVGAKRNAEPGKHKIVSCRRFENWLEKSKVKALRFAQALQRYRQAKNMDFSAIKAKNGVKKVEKSAEILLFTGDTIC